MTNQNLLNDLIEILEHDKTEIESFVEAPIKTTFEIKSHDFLEFAEKDLESEYKHQHINALSNAKRSLDCQVETLLIGFGMYKLCKKMNWNFPQKIEILNELGILSPRILSKINKTRNLMEHEFVNPNSEQVEDFIDVVSLFLAATDNYVYTFFSQKDLWFDHNMNRNLDSLSVVVNYEESKIEFNFIGYDKETEGEKGVYELVPDDPAYTRALRGYLKINLFGK